MRIWYTTLTFQLSLASWNIQSEFRALRIKMNLLVNGLLMVVSMMILLSFCEASASTGRFKNALHPGKCVLKPDLIRSMGEMTKFKFYGCARIICGKKSIAHIHTYVTYTDIYIDWLMIQIYQYLFAFSMFSCGVQSAARGCKLGKPIYPQAEYPICCIRQSICDLNKSTIHS